MTLKCPSFTAYIQYIKKFFWWQLQIISRIWPVLTPSTENAAVWAAIISHLYHFHSLPTGLPHLPFFIYIVFNIPDGAICLKHRSNSITPLLKISPVASYLIQSKSQNFNKVQCRPTFLTYLTLSSHLPVCCIYTVLAMCHIHWLCSDLEVYA